MEISVIVLVVIVLLFIYLFVKSINNRRNSLVFLREVLVGDKIPIDYVQGVSLFKLSSRVTDLKDCYKEIIRCCSRKNRYILFRAIESSSKYSIFNNKIIVTEIITPDELRPNSYVIIPINNVYYLRNVYRISDNILYYKFEDKVYEYELKNIILKVNFMFNENLLISYEK